MLPLHWKQTCSFFRLSMSSPRRTLHSSPSLTAKGRGKAKTGYLCSTLPQLMDRKMCSITISFPAQLTSNHRLGELLLLALYLQIPSEQHTTVTCNEALHSVFALDILCMSWDRDHAWTPFKQPVDICFLVTNGWRPTKHHCFLNSLSSRIRAVYLLF